MFIEQIAIKALIIPVIIHATATLLNFEVQSNMESTFLVAVVSSDKCVKMDREISCIVTLIYLLVALLLYIYIYIYIYI